MYLKVPKSWIKNKKASIKVKGDVTAVVENTIRFYKTLPKISFEIDIKN
jgi:hypothetical protein